MRSVLITRVPGVVAGGVALVHAQDSTEIGVAIRDLRTDETTRAGLDRPGGAIVQDVRAGGDEPVAGAVVRS